MRKNIYELIEPIYNSLLEIKNLENCEFVLEDVWNNYPTGGGNFFRLYLSYNNSKMRTPITDKSFDTNNQFFKPATQLLLQKVKENLTHETQISNNFTKGEIQEIKKLVEILNDGLEYEKAIVNRSKSQKKAPEVVVQLENYRLAKRIRVKQNNNSVSLKLYKI